MRSTQTHMERERDTLKAQFEEFKAEMERRTQRLSKQCIFHRVSFLFKSTVILLSNIVLSLELSLLSAADSERLEERKSFEKRMEELQSSLTSRSSQGSREMDDVRRERDRLELTRSQLSDQVSISILQSHK